MVVYIKYIGRRQQPTTNEGRKMSKYTVEYSTENVAVTEGKNMMIIVAVIAFISTIAAILL